MSTLEDISKMQLNDLINFCWKTMDDNKPGTLSTISVPTATLLELLLEVRDMRYDCEGLKSKLDYILAKSYKMSLTPDIHSSSDDLIKVLHKLGEI